MIVRLIVRPASLLGALCIAFGSAFAQLPQPGFTTIFPAGAKRGSIVSATIAGTEIDGAGLRFTHRGISATVDPKDAKKFQVVVASDVPPGIYDVRVTSKLGVSNPRRFAVGALLEADEAKDHKTRDGAQELAMPCVVNGKADSQGDDWFKVTLRKGQSVRLHCAAEELDSKLVPAFALFDAAGRELQRARADAIEWTATSDGPLFIRLSDAIYRGGNDYPYRLGITERGMPARRPDTLWPWPSAAANITENEPDDAAHPQDITLPASIRGSFHPAHGKAVYRFTAKKGDVWRIDLVSQRLGLPTNPRVVVQRIQDGNGTDVLELDDTAGVSALPDFDPSHLDPTGRFEVKEDGEYRLLVQDQNNSKGDPARLYTLHVRKAAPDFALVACAVPATPNKPAKDFNGAVISVCNHNLRHGETMPVRVFVLRRDGFSEPIHIKASALPKGITSSETLIDANTDASMIFLTAAKEAAAGAFAFQIAGTAGSTSHLARGSTTIWNMAVNEFIEPSRWRFTDEHVLGVVDDLVFPVSLACDPPPAEIGIDGKVKLTVHAARRAGFNDALKLKPAGISGLDKAKDLDLAASANSADYELDLAPLKLKPGVQTMWFTSTAKMKATLKGKATDVNAPVYSTPIILMLTESTKK